MAGENQRNKDKAMAARMKREGIKRDTAKCPICNNIVSLRGIYNHIVTCK